METFIKQASLFSEIRKKYLEKYDQIQNEKKKLNTTKVASVNQEFYSNSPLTDSQLDKLGESIIKEYEVKLHTLHPADDTQKFPIELMVDIRDQFDGFNKDRYRPNYNHIDTQTEIRSKQMKFYTDNKSENCKKVYQMCIEEIRKHNIDIYGVEKDLSNFGNGGSSICVSEPLFTFHCRKNNFKFKILFDDDCDCFPGILSVMEVEDINNGMKINIRCDLFHQNMSVVELKNFIRLINNVSYEKYIEERFGHFIRMPDLLRHCGFVVNYLQQSVDNKHASDNYHDFKFVIEVMSKEGECYVIPYYEQDSQDYILYICPTLKEINRMNKTKPYYHEITKIDVNAFYRYMLPVCFKLNYNPHNINNLVTCINSYISYKNGNYGYYQDNKYYNEHMIQRYIETHYSNKESGKVTFDKFSNNFTGPDFDVFISYVPVNDNIWMLLSHRLKDMEYPYDYYGIHFYYDKQTDPVNCILIIEGKYHDFTKVLNEYFNKKYDNLKSNINNVSEKVQFKGNYLECFEKIIQFLDGITNISSVET